MAKRDEWFRVVVRGEGITVLVMGRKDALQEQRRLRAQYPGRTVTMERDQ